MNDTELRKRIAACFDVAPDGAHCTLAVAAMLDDGRVRTEIAGAWPSTDAARGELPGLLERIRPAALAWYPAGPAAALAPILRPAAIRYNKRPGKPRPGQLAEDGELNGGKVAEVCQGLASLAQDRRLVHNADPLLDSHVGGAQKLSASDGWRFTRHGGGHVDAAYAAAGAVYVAATMPPVKRARIRMLG